MTDAGQTKGSASTEPGAEWDERALEPLVKTMESLDREQRRSAALALGHIRDRRVIVPLTRALRDPDAEVRRWAVLGLGRLGEPEAIPAMIHCLRETGPLERAAVAEALTAMGPAGVPALIEVLRRPYPDTRCEAAAVLGRIADERVVGPLVRALGAPEMRLRMAAAAALGQAALHPGLEVRAALPPLRRLARQEQGGFYRGVIAQIEQVTAATAHLPIPADGPAPAQEHLPLPAQAPPPDLQDLPLPSQGPPEDTEGVPRTKALGWLRDVRLFLQGRRSGRNSRP